MDRIAIVGVGAMGSYFAVKLAEAGKDVTVIDVDRARLDIIARDGIAVRDDLGERSVPVKAVVAADAAGPVDLVIMFTKGMHTASAIQSTRHLISSKTVALTLQNGLGNDLLLANAFGPDNVVIGITYVPADLTGPNSVFSHGKSLVVIGGYNDAALAYADQVDSVLQSAGFPVELDRNVKSKIWGKVAFNCAMNAVSAVTGFAVGGMNSEPGRRILHAAAAEAADVAEAMGVAVDRTDIAKQIHDALQDHPNHKPSMLQDLLAGRRTEIDNIGGAVVSLAEQHMVPTPVNRVLVDLVRMLECADGRS